MKDSIKIAVGVLTVTGSAMAQQSVGVAADPNPTRYQVVQTDGGMPVQPNGVVILNNNSTDVKASARARAYAQPVTTVEASPLVESRAGNLRKARENAEVSTEQRIVEKLEESRLEDEKRRADRLFGSRLEEPVKQEEAKPVVVAPPVQQAPAPAQPQVVVIQAPEYREPVAPRAEIKEKPVFDREDDEMNPARWYVAGLLGTSDYTSVSNVQGNFAGGVSVGQEYKKGLILEGSFLFSNYYLSNYWTLPAYQNVDQYGFTFAAKYQFLRSHAWLHPFIGGVAGYTYRRYTTKIGTASLDSSLSSNAFDLGATFGADARLTEEFSVGADFRYMANVFAVSSNSFIDGNNQYYGYGAVKPLEKVGYWTFLVSAKYHF